MKKFLLGLCVTLFVIGTFVALMTVRYLKNPRTFLILFQNNYELRPTGGFLGSYGKLKIAGGMVADLSVQDIYVPDGQIQGHVEPPWPIQAAFGQGWFRLRDSNFDPDFAKASQTMQWFFQKGGEGAIDGVIAVNLTVFGEILDVLGPLSLPDESELLTKENFYHKMQSEAEIGFFPGSQQKQVYLSKAARATQYALEHATIKQKLELLSIALKLIKEKHILVHFNDPKLQRLARMMQASGELRTRRYKENYFSFFEANLGSNKANCCVDRKVSLTLSPDKSVLRHEAILTFTNHNPVSISKPPYIWGGAYLSYLQVLLPIEANVTSIQVGDVKKIPLSDSDNSNRNALESALITIQATEDAIATHSAMQVYEEKEILQKRLKNVGFFVWVDALKSEQVRLFYDVPKHTVSASLCLQKQSGVSSIVYFLQKGHRQRTVQLVSDDCVAI